MKSVLNYSNNSDQELYLQEEVQLEKNIVKLKAATIASELEKSNEDAFAIYSDNQVLFAAVFDGTTSLKPIKFLGQQTGARFASHFLKDTFPQINQSTPKELMLELNKRLLQTSSKFEGASLEDTHTLPSSTGTIVKIDASKNIFTFAHVSDSVGIVFYKYGQSAVFTDDRNSTFDNKIFALIARIAKEKKITPRKAREDEEVKEALIQMFIERNNNLNGNGCGVLNGDPKVELYVQTGKFSLKGVKAILLATDGLLPQGWSEHNENDRQEILNEIQAGGFQKLFKTKRQSEDADPDWDHIRYKHSDDATGILIEW